MNWIKTFVQGMIFGVANVIPGFSGGTIAYMLGIYEKLLIAISDLLPNRNKKRKEYLLFLGFLGVGAALAILIFSGVITYILDTPHLAEYFYFFIIGSILGSISIVVLHEEDMNLSFIRLLIMIGTILGFLYITNSLNIGENNNLPEVTNKIFFFKITEMDLGYYLWLFFIGIIAAGAMILPGFSGSALFVSLGEYYNILYFIEEMMIVPLIFLALGCALGVLLLSKVLTVLLERFRGGTTYSIIGLMLASIYILYNEMNGINFEQIILNIIFLVVGFLLAFFINQHSKKVH
ncbi:DUF368 domain-containing protein [Vallitalea okinawensis]|uniref:DUF368 domain-containing protein n=1 Tax=Vallitalea okinawensis TaxID=2078660 RepID=UPI000CFAB98A|nr:DUF368 domain-containing protein [Vallitalea okinawensis]